MSNPRAFLQIGRAAPPKRDARERVRDWQEVEGRLPRAVLTAQGERCMDCGVPFCHTGCPLGNHVPDWNEAMAAGRWKEAWERLEETNNFPEITGRICPAPCEDACVLNLQGQPVMIRQIERQIADAAFARGWVEPQAARPSTGRTVAVVGSGPAGLAAAQQLARAGHAVTVFERDEAPGGLLRFGIPDFKFDRAMLDLRLTQLRGEGVQFKCGVTVGVDLDVEALRRFDAVLLALGASAPRPMTIPGSGLPGVQMAMDFLVAANRAVAAGIPPEDLRGQRVIVFGGGDTGADGYGTALRQGADVLHFHYKPAPPEARDPAVPWPFPPILLRPSSSHEEGGERGWSVVALAFEGDAALEAVRVGDVRWTDGRMEVVGERLIPADRALIALGFVGTDAGGWVEELGVRRTPEGTLATEGLLAAPGVWACGDARQGASLVVHAIAEGRRAARAIDEALGGRSRLRVLPERSVLFSP
jgi:glutamate synthase (NADPH/NADH) small chain